MFGLIQVLREIRDVLKQIEWDLHRLLELQCDAECHGTSMDHWLRDHPDQTV